MSSSENFEIVILPRAEKHITDLGFEDLEDVYKALELIGANPRIGHRVKAGEFRPLAYTFEVIKGTQDDPRSVED